jgi:adenylate cyclase
MFLPRKHRPLHALLIAVLGAGLLLAAHGTTFMRRIEWISYDWRVQHVSPARPAPKDIAIVLVDDASLQYMDARVGRWPWPRSVFADLIDFIELGGPRAIVFDMLFVERQQGADGADHDERLMEATRAAGNVYHAMQLMADSADELNAAAIDPPLPAELRERFDLAPHTGPHPNPGACVPDTINRLHPCSRLPQGEGVNNEANYNNYLIPIDGLHQAAAGLGVVTVDPDADNVLRRARLTASYHGALFPALSLAPLLHGADVSAVHLRNSQLFRAGRPIPLTADGSYLVNMYRAFETYSASGLLDSVSALNAGEVDKMMVDPQTFAGKYVFIGASAVGLHDLKTTALGELTPGVNVHASVLGNALAGDFLAPPDELVTALAIIVLAAAASLGILLMRTLWLQLALPLMLGLAYSGVTLWLFSHNKVWELVMPLAALALCAVTSYGLVLFTEGREKTKIRRMFSQYVSPAALSVMVDQFEDYSGAGAGSKETVSVLFADIRGFTSLSENSAPEEIVQMLNHYFAAMTEAIHAHHGTIDKFIGDAIMAVWGAPIKSATHADDAVRAALQMREKLIEINAWLAARGATTIDIGIGINSGEVVMGSIGSALKADYTVIGDNVNLASRLEGLTKLYDCPLLISESTLDAMTRPMPCRIVDLVRVKGKQHPIRIYAPIAAGEMPDAQAQRISDRTAAAFAAYLARDWEGAVAELREWPDDPLCQALIQRCRDYQLHDPGADWDGVHTMNSK